MSEGSFSEPQAAAMLEVSDRTLRRWRNAGRVSFYRSPGGRVHYTLDQILALRFAMRHEADAPLTQDGRK